MAKKKYQIIRAPDDLRRRAVNFKKGMSLTLSPTDVARIEKVIEESRDSYVAALGRNLHSLRSAHAAATATPAERPAFLKKACQEAFGIKGLGGTLGYPVLTAIAKNLHDFLFDRMDASNVQMEIIGNHIDALYMLIERRVTGAGTEIELAILKGLQEIVDRHK